MIWFGILKLKYELCLRRRLHDNAIRYYQVKTKTLYQVWSCVYTKTMKTETKVETSKTEAWKRSCNFLYEHTSAFILAKNAGKSRQTASIDKEFLLSLWFMHTSRITACSPKNATPTFHTKRCRVNIQNAAAEFAYIFPFLDWSL